MVPCESPAAAPSSLEFKGPVRAGGAGVQALELGHQLLDWVPALPGSSHRSTQCAHPGSLCTGFPHACEVDVSTTVSIAEIHMKAQAWERLASRLHIREAGVLASQPKGATPPPSLLASYLTGSRDSQTPLEAEMLVHWEGSWR